MRIYLGADHAGLKLKEKVKKYLEARGGSRISPRVSLPSKYKIFDLGAKKFMKTDDYPDYAKKVASKVALASHRTSEASSGSGLQVAKSRDFGILFCGSGHGMCIAANKVKGIRAVAVSTAKEAKITREHNDANVLCLSGWRIPFVRAKKIIETFLKTPFSREKRHIRRIEKIRKIEEAS